MFESDIEYISGAFAQEEFISLIYSQNTIAEICAQLNINPAAVAFVRKKDSNFNDAINEAQSVLMDLKVDKLLTIHEDIENPLMARVVSDNIKWTASKRAKDKYGDKVDVNVTHTLDLKEAIALARSRQLNFIDGNAVELKEITTDNKTVEHEDTPDLESLDVFA